MDELIAAQARKVDALKTHERGLMQQLFPAKAKPNRACGFRSFGMRVSGHQRRLKKSQISSPVQLL
ncbi:MAG: hypothetical protein R3E55_10780 [Burkholderiaceae bacterium]